MSMEVVGGAVDAPVLAGRVTASITTHLPEFPQLRQIELGDRPILQAFTAEFPPYSDFNFASLWAWNISGQTRIGRLGGNLVVLLGDYLTGERLLSLLGTDDVGSASTALIDEAECLGCATLKLIPETVARQLSGDSMFRVAEDRDNFDYLLSTAALANMPGRPWREKRWQANKFDHVWADQLRVEDLTLGSGSARQRVQDLFNVWVSRQGATDDVTQERKALERLLAIESHLDLCTTGIWIDDTLVGFSVNERLTCDTAICHFEKADITFGATYSSLKRHVGRRLAAGGCSLLNFEQDLGIPGLRTAKTRLRPVAFLRKYTVTRASA